MKHNAETSYEVAEDDSTVTFIIRGYISPFYPAKIFGRLEDCEPESGRDLDEFEVSLDSVMYWDASTGSWLEDKDLTDEHKDKLCSDFDARIHNEKKLYEEIQELLIAEVDDE